MASEAHEPGITVRSIAASLLCMVVMAVMLVFGESIEGSGWFYGMHVLAVPAMVSFLALFVLIGVFHAIFKIHLLTRNELVCVLFSLLIAVPIMGLGFWTNYIWIGSTMPSQGDFAKMDAISDRLWPHGPNLLDSVFDASPAREVITHGEVEWRDTEYEEGVFASIPHLVNRGEDGLASVRVRLSLEDRQGVVLTLGEKYLLSVLARGTQLGANAALTCRVYYDGNEGVDIEAFSEPRPVEKATFLHKKGFQRYGVYGVEFSSSVRDYIEVEFQLRGRGVVELADPKLMSVAAFENLFAGRQTVSEIEYQSMRGSDRSPYVVKPASMWSFSGLGTTLLGRIPLNAWKQPVMVWTSFISLFMLATFAVALIMRRQWVKNERYPLPVARIPRALLGVEEDGQEKRFSDIWRNRTMWLGFALCLIWCLMRAWHVYNPNVPNMEIDVRLKPYFDDPGWGRMWNDVSFSISAFVLSIAVFMELNVLLSLVIGFFLFRSLHWIGEAYGWNIASVGKFGVGQYPYGDEQMISAFLTYALLTLFFTRKYLWKAIKSAVQGQRQKGVDTNTEPDDEPELVSYRAAFCMLIAAFGGALLWGQWVGVSTRAMLVLFGAMVLIGFVAMKLRAECGTPFAFFAPGIRLLVPLLGGMVFFGASGAMLASWFSLGMLLLFLIPGLQMEFVEISRRAHIRSRHVFYTLGLGIAGGMLIGGWFLLSSMYGIGSNNSGFSYWFAARPWEFYPYIECERIADAAVSQANVSALANAGADGIDPATWGYIGAAVATAAVTLLRQWFPGFWFHPIAILVGGTSDGLGMMMYWSLNIWGSLLAAWTIRFAVLKIGGAAAVRNRLFPFFIGVFLAVLLAHVIFFGVNAYFYFFDPTVLRQGVVF